LQFAVNARKALSAGAVNQLRVALKR